METVGCESDAATAITALRRSGGQMRLRRTMIVDSVEEGMAVAESCGTTGPIVWESGGKCAYLKGRIGFPDR